MVGGFFDIDLKYYSISSHYLIDVIIILLFFNEFIAFMQCFISICIVRFALSIFKKELIYQF